MYCEKRGGEVEIYACDHCYYTDKCPNFMDFYTSALKTGIISGSAQKKGNDRIILPKTESIQSKFH